MLRIMMDIISCGVDAIALWVGGIGRSWLSGYGGRVKCYWRKILQRTPCFVGFEIYVDAVLAGEIEAASSEDEVGRVFGWVGGKDGGEAGLEF